MNNTATPCRRLLAVLVIAALVPLGSCSINPATGQRQLSLIGEQQEIAMGQQYDQQIQQQFGTYPDESMQRYIQALGVKLASQSERPHLPWTFRVLDDPTVNAFATPGGHVYITRGILAHFNSEAQLMGVIGHEIGHITARHSVEQMSRAQLAQLGLGVAAVASERFREYAGLATVGLQVLFLKFSRDDERQSDDLGLRYMTRTGYDPYEVPKVFDMLDKMANLQGGQRIPTWQSTHPRPERRAQRLTEQIAALPEHQQHGIIEQEGYVRRLEGMVFGDNPREGYTIGNAFYQPDMRFKMTFPSGWKIVNQRQAVVGVSPSEDALVVLTLAKGDSIQEATQAFFSQEGVERGQSWRRNYFNFRTTPQTDPNTGSEQFLQGLVGFEQHQGRVFQIMTYANKDTWQGVSASTRRAVTSFEKLTQQRYLNVEPKRIKLVTTARAMTLQQFNQQYPSTISLEELAVINGIAPGALLERGALIKRVTGGELPRS